MYQLIWFYMWYSAVLLLFFGILPLPEHLKKCPKCHNEYQCHSEYQWHNEANILSVSWQQSLSFFSYNKYLCLLSPAQRFNNFLVHRLLVTFSSTVQSFILMHFKSMQFLLTKKKIKMGWPVPLYNYISQDS